ncbi:heterokaryon incompatibility protein-domain-containing protein [Xylaria castorea]|nr:heterokaryon incompatibility protein-domain-containing protein [Xylaria castorea]
MHSALHSDHDSCSAIEASLGSWPRRLLHIKTMNSYPWQPGNIYGVVKEPKYNAVSYTWGRWQLKDNEQPEVTALEVHGTPWAIPRVDPQHFSADNFRHVLNIAAGIPDVAIDKNRTTAMNIVPVDFIWLDVACIDQRFNRESMLEIGRQAEIFRNASFVYIWLSRTSADSLDDAAFDIRDLRETAARNIPERRDGLPISVAELENDFDRDWLDYGLRSLQSFHGDPWFTSLWTLQEAFLCKDACFLSKEGSLAWYLWPLDSVELRSELEGDQRIFCLNELLRATANVREYIEAKTYTTIFEDQPKVLPDPHTLDFFNVTGLNALSRDNPMELYAAAISRKPSRELDSVYGIMQVFRFRLGESNPHSKPGTVYGLVDLEDELGLALMNLSPVLSQSFRHTTWPRDLGRNWRVTKQSTVPGQGFTDNMPWTPQAYTSNCKLGVQRVNSVLLGHFQGSVCSFSVLEAAWNRFNDSDTYTTPRWMNGESDMCTILDIAPDLFPDLEDLNGYNLQRGPGQYTTARTLRSQFKASDAQVLHLGYYEPEAHKRTHFGLVLLRTSATFGLYWRRLGVCTWDVGTQRPDPIVAPDEEVISDKWRPIYLQHHPLITEEEEEEVEQIKLYWDDLSLHSTSWQLASGTFG